MKFDVLVIGAGINGLATAYHLSQKPHLKIGIVDQFSVGNAHGGSHGASRIIRTIYTNPIYTRLAQRAQREGWVELQKESNKQLIYPNPACYFGPGKTFEHYAQSVIQSGLEIDLLNISAARRLYPQFHFKNLSTLLHDRTSGIIAANETINQLATLIIKNGVELRENTKVLNIDSNQDPIKITTDKGEIFTERLVITAGAWINQLLPELNFTTTPIRQAVAYFKLHGPQNLYQPATFPNWAFIGDGDNQIFYGLPEFGSEGIKVVQHVTVGEKDDPDEKITTADPKQIETLRNFVKECFVQPIDKVVKSETCFYTNIADERFIIDLFPTDERIAVGCVCSGHGFKFAPLTGRLLSELVLNGKTTVPEFEKSKEEFKMMR